MFMFREVQSRIYSPPDIEEFFNYGLWGIHEAAFMLTTWPKNGLLYSTIGNLPEDIEKERPWFYLPKKSFDPKDFGKPFEKVFYEMKQSIENDWLPARSTPLFGGVCYLVRPWDVLCWALSKSMMLPEKLQEVSGIYLFEPKGKKTALERKVKNKIVTQFILSKNQDAKLSEIIEHPLMEKFVTEKASKISRHKMIEEHINELKKSAPDCVYEPIPEIVRKSSGRTEYHMRSLIIGMVTAAMIKSYQKWEVGEIHESFEDYAHDFFNDPIVGIYLDEAPEVIKRVVFERIAFSAPDVE